MFSLWAGFVYGVSICFCRIPGNFAANQNYKKMKAKQKSVQYLYRVIMAVWLLSGVVQVAYPEEPEGTQKIDWNNTEWDKVSGTESDKSGFYPPVTAYIESSVLYICNERPAGAIDVAIFNEKSGRLVWEQVVPESASGLVAIPLDGLPAGSYSLQLANEWGGYLIGSFRK